MELGQSEAPERLPGFFKWAAMHRGYKPSKARYLYQLGVAATDEILDALDKDEITLEQALQLLGDPDPEHVTDLIEEKHARTAGRRVAHEEAEAIAAEPDFRILLDCCVEILLSRSAPSDQEEVKGWAQHGYSLFDVGESADTRSAA
jgi:hypothetical protein